MNGGRERITVVVIQEEDGKPPLRYRRSLAGLTVQEALKELEREEIDEGTFPTIFPPVRVNREDVEWCSGRVLEENDVLVVEGF